MNCWQEILKTAIVGTERNALTLPARHDALGDALAGLNTEAREASLLIAAATVALYERAGQLPAIDSQALPVPAELDDAPCCNARAAQQLSLMLSGEYKEVLSEWLAAMAAAGKRVTEESLPALLALGKTNEALQGAIGKVIGKRGVWLAQQNPDWDYVVAKLDESHWHTGTRNMRLALLQQLRATDPARARELVASTWNEEKPEDRAAFVATFITGLSLEDESFLEATLDDRRKEVRKAAAELLARLPESALVQRMIARVKPLVNHEHKSSGKSALSVLLPEQCDKAMQRDGIELKLYKSNIGEKAGWLEQMLGVIPPSFWNESFGMSNLDLLTSRPKDWNSIFLIGWAQAAKRFVDTSWLETLLDFSIDHNTFLEPADLLVSLPPNRQEVYLLKLLTKHISFMPGSLELQIITNDKYSWSGELSRNVYQTIISSIKKATILHEYWVKHYLQLIALKFHSSVLHEILSKLEKDRDQLDPHISEYMITLQTTLQFRADMLKEIMQ